MDVLLLRRLPCRHGCKTFFRDEWPCCSGTYIQTVADCHNVIYLYLHDDTGLKCQSGHPLRGQSEARRPDRPSHPANHFPINRRDHAHPLARAPCRVSTLDPNQWGALKRTWQPQDTVVVRFPMQARLVPVDSHHLNRVAFLYGPLLMAPDARFSFTLHGDAADLAARLGRVPDKLPASTWPRRPRPPQRRRPENHPASIDEGGQKVGNLHSFYTFRARYASLPLGINLSEAVS